MKIYQPHHSKLIVKLENKRKTEEFNNKIKEGKDAEIGSFLGNRFNDLFDNDYYVKVLMERIIIKGNRYILSLTESDCENFTFSMSPFELNPENIDLGKPGNLWKYMILVFSKGEKYNSQTSIKAFKDTVAYNGIKIENIMFSDDENKIFNLEFSKLEELPSQFKKMESNEPEYILDEESFFEEFSMEEQFRDYMSDLILNVLKVMKKDSEK